MEPALFNPDTGRLDAARIARELNFPVAMIAEAIGRKAPGVPEASRCQQPAERTASALSDLGCARGSLRRRQDECAYLLPHWSCL
jgi:hypothetical protein